MTAKDRRSRKPSVASSRSRQRDSLVFFLDRSLGRDLAAALRGAGAEVVLHDDEFSPTAPDEEWLRRCGSEGWIVLTKDRNIRYNPLETSALMRSGTRAFVLASGNLTGAEIAAFVHALAKIRRLTVKTPAPFIGKVFRNGSVQIWLS